MGGSESFVSLQLYSSLCIGHVQNMGKDFMKLCIAGLISSYFSFYISSSYEFLKIG